MCELGFLQCCAGHNAHTYFCICISVFAFLYLYFVLCCSICARSTVHSFVLGTMLTRHTVHGIHCTLHTAHGTMQRHKADGTMLTQRLNPPSSLQPLSANSSPHIASHPQHQVFQWELSTWTQLEPKRFRHSSFGWGCPSLLSFYVFLKTVESTLIGLSKKGIYFVI